MIEITATKREQGKITVKFRDCKKKTFNRRNTLGNILVSVFLYFWR